MKPILILKAGSTFPEVKEKLGDFEDWIIHAASFSRSSFDTYGIRSEANSPDINDYSGLIITGSHDNVTDQFPWITELTHWLQSVRTCGKPVLGICFGHQILAYAFGGKVGFSLQGRELGSVEVAKSTQAEDDFLFAALPGRFMANESHAQSVLLLPPGAIRLASNHHSENQAFRLDHHIWGVQFHPEFSQAHLQVYVDRYHNSKLPKPPIMDTPESKSLLRIFSGYCLNDTNL